MLESGRCHRPFLLLCAFARIRSERHDFLCRGFERGEYPFIFRDDDKTFNVPGFNHLHYAMTRSQALCGGK